MAKDKQMFDGDKAISFQRAVFIVCNLKRLIKRPKKEEKQAGGGGLRRRSGASNDGGAGAGGEPGAEASSSGLRRNRRAGRRGGSLKEPVRRAFTLPSMLCGTLGNAGGQLHSILSGDDGKGDQNSLVATTAAANSDEVQLRQPEPLLPTTALVGATLNAPANQNSNKNNNCSVSCLTTPVRRAQARQRGAGQSRSPRRTRCPDSDVGQARRRPTTVYLVEQQRQRQTICPVWAHVMGQLDKRLRRPTASQGDQELGQPPSHLPYLAGRHHADALFMDTDEEEDAAAGAAEDDDDDDEGPELLVGSWPTKGEGGDGGDDDDNYELTTKQPQDLSSSSAAADKQRRSSNGETEKATWLRPTTSTTTSSGAYQHQLGHSCCDRQSIASGHSTSPSSDVSPYAVSATRKRQQQVPAAAVRSPEAEQQVGAGSELSAAGPNSSNTNSKKPMKRFSSALCLADDSVAIDGGQQRPHQLQITSSRNKAANKFQQVRGKNQQRKSTGASLAPSSTHTETGAQRRPSTSSQAAAAANLDQQALFSAVECNQLERAKSILEEGKANVNSLNGDKLTCLDVAVLLRNAEMARLLQQHHAKESSAYLAREARQAHLQALYAEARRLVEDLSHSLGAIATQAGGGNALPTSGSGSGPGFNPSSGSQVLLTANATNQDTKDATLNTQSPLMLATGSLLSSALLEEKQRQLQYWKRRLDLFMHMRFEFEQLQVPNAPELIVLQVVGEQSLGVKIVHSLQANCYHSRPRMSRAAPGGCDDLELGSNDDDDDDLVMIKPLRAPPAHLKCLDGSRCSHHSHLAELLLSEASVGSPPGVYFDQELAGSDKQQKLAVFNQLLQQQLRLLSSQQVLANNSEQNQATAKQQKKSAFLNTQSSSTESACESLQSRQSGAGALDTLEPPASIAYRLMTASTNGQHRAIGGPKPTTGDLNLNLNLKNDKDHHHIISKRQVVIITKYKVEWALNEHFEPILGSMIVYNTNQYPIECQIDSLKSGQLLWVRVSSGNHAGFCPPQPSTPACLAPSSWRQVEGQVGRRQHQDQEVFRKFTKLILLNKHILDDHQPQLTGDNQQQISNNKSNLINMLLLDATLPAGYQQALPGDTSSSSKVMELQQEQQQASGVSMRKNLKNFFQSNSFKFNKLNNQNKRGLYLTAVVYSSPMEDKSKISSNKFSTKRPGNLQELSNSQDKIVVTNDDRLPVIEVTNEVVAPAALMSDFYWLLKINGTQWMDIKRLRQQLQKSHSSSTLHLRIKILSAVEQLQSALNMEDIGRLFYKPIQAHDGSIVICTCKRVQITKLVGSLSIKWTHLHKIIPRHLRKISDSMLNAEHQQQQQQQQASTNIEYYGSRGTASLQTRKSTISSSGLGGATILPGTTVFHPDHHQDTSKEATRLAWQCDNCQAALNQRRFTMASGSSNSSLATTDSQASSQSTNTCNCQHHHQVNQINQTPSHHHQRASLMPSAISSQASSSGGGIQRPASLSVGGSSGGPTGTTTSAGSRHSSQSAAGQLAPAPQKTSTYLMLASLTMYDLLLFTLNEIIHFHQASQLPLQRGLYLGFLQLQTTVESMRLLVPRARPNMVPCARVRDNPHVSREEWQLLKRFGSCSFLNTFSNDNNKADLITKVEQDNELSAQARNQRASDPSIWSLSEIESRPQEVATTSTETSGDDDGNQLNAGGRDRAKSVSPGLIKHLKQQQVSISSESVQRQALASTLAPQTIPQATLQADTHSDTELGATVPVKAGEASEALSDTDLRISSIQEQPVKRRTKGSSSNSNRIGRSQQQQSPSSASRITASSLNALPSYALQSAPEETFVRLLGSAARRLLDELRSQLPKVLSGNTCNSILQSLNDDENNRIYHVELIELSNQVTFVLLLPAPENVCPVTSQEKSNILADNKEYMLLPLQIFETIHISTYEPELLGKYSRLSTILETDLIVAQHDHRQAFSSNELKSTKSRVSHLQDMVNIADEFWRKLRWIVDVVSFARDKSSQTVNGGIRLSSIWRYFELASPGGGIFSLSFYNRHHQQDTCSFTGSCGTSHNNAESMTLSVSGQQLHHRRTALRSTGNQQYQQPEEESQVGVRGTGMEVKRTTSAKISSRGIQQQHGFIQVPEIYLNRPTQASKPSTAVVVTATNNPRRHSGGESSTHKPTTMNLTACDSYQQQAHRDNLDETSWLDFRLSTGGNEACDDDDQAIYAYHISLKDATRAAAQRKSSQLSIRPFMVGASEIALESPGSVNDKAEPVFPLISSPLPHLAVESQNQPSTSKQESFDTVRQLNFQQSPTLDAKDEQQAVSKPQKMRHLKATNPFISDSFD